MSKFAGARKYLKSNSRKIKVERSKTTAKVYKCDEFGKLYLSRHIFLWPKLIENKTRSNQNAMQNKETKTTKEMNVSAHQLTLFSIT